MKQPKPQNASTEAHAYAQQVIDGKIVACKWVKAACKRHFRDLERSAQADYPYRFDSAKADRACKFIEALPHTKGRWAARREDLKLGPWQKFITCSLFGWVSKSTGRYRFTECYVCVPRKNGKSPWAAAVGQYKFAADGEFGSEVYSGATTEKQAWEVFRPARLMAQRTPALCKAFGISVNAKSLVIESNGSRFEPVIGKPGDGASPSCAIIDEYHEHPDSSLYDTMKTGMVGRENPLLAIITTAGSDRSGPCYDLQKDVEKILSGVVENDQIFGIIFTIDEGDDWTSEAALIKANPNYGVSVDGEKLRSWQVEAMQNPRKQNIFKTKHLNVWVNATVAWMDMVKWDKSADPSLKLEQFVGEECFVGLDLASRVDIASKIRLFRREIDGVTHFYAFGTHYLNQERIDDSAGEHYRGWANQEFLTVTPGNVTDYNRIGEDLVKDALQFSVIEIDYDPYHGPALVQSIQAHKEWPQTVEFVEVRQTVEKMSPAMKELEAIVYEGRLHHDGDPILAWMISNVMFREDIKGNVFPRKERPENKIDGAIALLMPISRATTQPPAPGSLYSDGRGVMFV